MHVTFPVKSLFLVFCQTLGLVLRLRVDFVLPLSQQQEEEEPLTKNLAVGSILEG